MVAKLDIPINLKTFYLECKKWLWNDCCICSGSEGINHSATKAIISIGKPMIPIIFSFFQNGYDKSDPPEEGISWEDFYILEQLTGIKTSDMISFNDRGKYNIIFYAWWNWWQEKGKELYGKSSSMR